MMQKEKQLVPQLRFPEFEGEWKKKKVSAIGTFLGGGTPDSNKEKYWNGNIPWISSSDITEESIHSINKTRFISKEAIKESATKIIPKGSVLMVSRVGIGKFAVSDEDLCTSQDFTNLVTNNDEFFTTYYFKARLNRFLRLSQGTSIKGFTIKDVKNAKFAFPFLPEQQKIADFLSAVDTRLQNLKKKKTLLEQYKKGAMHQIFKQEIRFKNEKEKEFPDWEVKKFSKFIKLYRGSSPRPINRYLTKEESGVNWIKIGDTKTSRNYLLESVTEKITLAGSLKSRKVRKGELILANSMSFGKTYVLNIDRCIYDGWFVLREFEDYFEKRFLIQQLNSEFLQRQYRKLSTGGVVQNISSDIVYSTKLMRPCLQEQTKIANFLSAIDQKIDLVHQQIGHSKTYKKGLLQQLFV